MESENYNDEKVVKKSKPTIVTNLPYSEELEPEIAENGAIVDLSKFFFPHQLMSDPIKTAFIYLRNTGYCNLVFDFSKCDYNRKKEYLIKYMQSNMHFLCPELVSTWLYIMNYYQGFIFKMAESVDQEDSVSLFSILNKEEIEQFISEYKDTIESYLQFIQSLPIYLIIRLKTEIKIENDFPRFEGEKNFGKNIYYLARNNACNLLMIGNHQFETLYYKDEFTEENNELFESLYGLDYYQYLRTIATEPELWKEIMTSLIELDRAVCK